VYWLNFGVAEFRSARLRLLHRLLRLHSKFVPTNGHVPSSQLSALSFQLFLAGRQRCRSSPAKILFLNRLLRKNQAPKGQFRSPFGATIPHIASPPRDELAARS
jgi:hypothetical protein